MCYEKLIIFEVFYFTLFFYRFFLHYIIDEQIQIKKCDKIEDCFDHNQGKKSIKGKQISDQEIDINLNNLFIHSDESNSELNLMD